MPKLHKVAGATSQILQVFIQDSTSTTGGGKTGLAYNTASLTAYYHRDTDTTATAITLANMTVGTFTSGGFKEIDATNMPGWYQFCPPDAAFASGAKSVAFLLKGASGMAPVPIEIQIQSVNFDDSVRGGMTALPNAAAASSGGLPTVGTGSSQIDLDSSGRVNVGKWMGTAPTALTNNKVTAYVAEMGSAVIQAATFNAGAIDAAALAGDLNTYQAKVTLIDDNGGTTDRYVVAWYKNGNLLTSGITSPTIQVINAADASDLVASTAMTEIASGSYRHVEATNRIVDGVAYVAIVAATIDGSTRSFRQPVGRDS